MAKTTRTTKSHHAPEHIALYPGSFDPPTFGHLDVIRRGRLIFDRIIVGVGCNPDKQTLFSADERVDLMHALIDELITKEPNAGAAVEVRAYDGLTVDAAKRFGASVLLRGVRNISDMQYEMQQAVTNRQVAGIESAFVVAGQSLAYISSTLIRQITAMGEDTKALKTLCPPVVVKALQRKKKEGSPMLRAIADRP
ncbi:MAG: pantetheine-phosphate adenylyltransferase [Phycisphaerales bacterium]|nr:pantetheine-phosphate adenylyltransferase [Phycisphaerales bacterium]